MSVNGQLDEALIGRVLGDKFRLRRLIGTGASGTVYQADQTTLGRTVAVKILSPTLARDPKLVQRFHEEALAASRLNHPNTVSVIDYGQSNDGLLYLVMEYLRGTTLAHVIENEPPAADERIVDLVSQVLSGLEEAHHAGVIHADLKADNIMVERRRNDWDLVKVVDFGIARLMESPRAADETPTICGTPEYMAPEVISGEEPTVASDLYAVGVVLYELLTGVTPFAAPNMISVLTRHLHEEPRRPGARVQDRSVNRVLEEVVMKALAKKPADRFATALAFRNALEQALETEPGLLPAVIPCAMCGMPGSVKFKFCPECGYPRSDTVRMAGVRPGNDWPTMPVHPRSPRDIEDTLEDHGELVDRGRLWSLPWAGHGKALDALFAFVTGHDTAMARLVGAEGSGRTGIMNDLCRRAAQMPGVWVHRAQPDPTGLRAPFYPIRAVVSHILAVAPLCTYDSMSAALHDLDLSRRDLPGIAELFGHHGELWQLEPDVRHRELFASTLRVIRAAARRGRVVVCFENVDHYDRSSREFLAHLAESILEDPGAGAGSLRVIVTHGSALKEPWPQAVETIEVAPLTRDDLRGIAAHFTQHGLAATPEALRLTEPGGASLAQMYHWARLCVEDGHAEQMSQSVADLVAERVKALPHSARVLCQAVAVFGDEVAHDVVLQALGPRLGGSFDAALAILQRRGLLKKDEHRGVVGFASRLVRAVVYDATPAELRRELHRAAVSVLEPQGASALVLGHHHAMAGNLLEAADLLARAGDDAVHQFDDEGATLLYHRALHAARQLMLEGGDSHSRHRFVSLSVKLADALRIGGQVGLARGLIEEAKGQSDGNPQIDAQLLQASAHLCQSEGKPDEAIVALRRGIGLLLQVGEPQRLAELYLDLASMHMVKDDIQSAIAELSEGLDLVTLGEGHSATRGPEILWRLVFRLAQLHSAVEQHEKALELAESALIHARRVRSRIGSARVQALLASQYERTGKLATAERYRQAAVNEMRRLGDRRGTAELLLASVTPTRTLLRINLAYLREARELAAEVGWPEGVAIAQEKYS